MALGVKAIREALETRLSTYLNAGSRPTTVHAYPPDSLTYPAVGILAGEGDYITYWETFGTAGISSVRFTVRIYASARYIDAQMVVDDYVSAGSGFTASILNAVLADRTLGGVVKECRVLEVRGVTFDELTGGWVADIPVEVFTEKVAA